MMKLSKAYLALAACVLSMTCGTGFAAVSAQEAAMLKSTLTPMGAERAGNKEGTIPAWSGGMTAPIPGVENGNRRVDPFAGEKPLFSITAKNMAQYAAHLTEGTKALLQKYPDSFRLDVYTTHRTAAAPQWVYDNTYQNALNGKLVDSSGGLIPTGVYGGVPFPIPKTGAEAMWNHKLRWRGEAWHIDFNGYMTTSGGKRVKVLDASNDHDMPYYQQGGSADKFGGEYWLVRSLTVGPPIRAGEAITGRENVNGEESSSWVYLTGQRRVRKLPNACCDTPTPFSAGLVSFDEVEGFTGRMDRFDWKLIGKKEMYVPYNSNRSLIPKDDGELVGGQHLNPDNVRWELHRVWVVEATIREGKRHVSPKSRYYIDEDSWISLLSDRWDANGQLARTQIQIPVAMPDIPAQVGLTWGTYDLISGSMFMNWVVNEKRLQYKIVPPYPDSVFTPDAMAGDGVR
jgi:hypothetical protein